MEKELEKISEYVKNDKNILVIGKSYCCGKTLLLNKIMSKIEKKQKVLFISKTDELYKENKEVNHIVVNRDIYSKIDYEMIQKQGYQTVVIDNVDGFVFEKEGDYFSQDSFIIETDMEEKIRIFTDFFNIIDFLMKEKEINFIISVDNERKKNIKSIINFFEKLNQKQYKKKIIDIIITVERTNIELIEL